MYTSLALAALSAIPALAGPAVNVYWGQSGTDRLATYCQQDGFEYVTLAFVNNSPEQDTSGLDYPGTNFAAHCGPAVYKNGNKESKLLSECDQIAEDIGICQGLGKKVLLSVGGAWIEGTDYTVTGAQNGLDFANFLWGAFGPYSNTWKGPRPFDFNGNHVTVDGFDFDIEHTFPDQTGYVALLRQLRTLMGKGKYLLTGAPQCPLVGGTGNDMSTMISSVDFDALFIQFYNNPVCDGIPGKTPGDGFNFDTWADFIKLGASRDAKLFIGLPGAPVAWETGYLEPSAAVNLVNQYKNRASFGGVMIWDVVSGSAKTAQGRTYYQALHDAILGAPVSTSTVRSTTTSSSTTTSATSKPTCGTTYTVMPGDFVYAIATDHGLTVDQLLALNPDIDANYIYPGQMLHLTPPCSSTSSSQSSTTSSSASTSKSSTVVSPTSTSSIASSTSSSSSAIASSTSTSQVSSSSSTLSTSSSSSSSAAVSSTSTSSSSTTVSSSSTSTSTSSSAAISSTITSSTSSSSSAAVSSTSTSTSTSSSAAVSSTSSSQVSSSSSALATSTSSSSSSSATVSSTSSSQVSSSSVVSSTSSALSNASSSAAVTSSSISQSSSLASTSSSSTSASSSSTASSNATLTSTSTISSISSTSSVGSSIITSSPASTSVISSTRSSIYYGNSTMTTRSASSASSTDLTSSTATATSDSVSLSSTSTSTSVLMTTSTVSRTITRTVTSCAPTVTNCPNGGVHVTTEVVDWYTTICPVTQTEQEKPTSTAVQTPATTSDVPLTTSTVYTTSVYTITKCPDSVPNCPNRGSITTEVIALYTTVCPVTEAKTTPVVPTTTSAGVKTTGPPVVVGAQCPGGPNCPTAEAEKTTTTKVTTYSTIFKTVTKGQSTSSSVPVSQGNSTVPTGSSNSTMSVSTSAVKLTTSAVPTTTVSPTKSLPASISASTVIGCSGAGCPTPSVTKVVTAGAARTAATMGLPAVLAALFLAL